MRRSKRPDTVWLAGAQWTIKWAAVLPHSIYGSTTDSERVIRIQTGEATESFLRQLLVHEILHAAAFSCGGHWPTEEEHVVRLLERPLTSLFDDPRNAPVLAWLSMLQ
jgi:hypothetical protein